MRRYRVAIQIGAQFGYWTVVGEAAPAIDMSTDRRRGRCVRHSVHVRRFLCRCVCGTERAVRATGLLKNTSQSCGCYHRERVATVSTRHGEMRDVRRGGRESREYRAWISMKGRCYTPSTSHYELYGGRGITVCERWRHSFEAFLADVGRKPTEKHSLDRIDVNGHYEPGNVRWATQKEQLANRRK